MGVKISEGALITNILRDRDLQDVSVLISEGPDVWDTQSIAHEFQKGIIAEKIGVDFFPGGVPVDILLDWKCDGKIVIPKSLGIVNKTGGKNSQSVSITLGTSPGATDIMLEKTLTGWFALATYRIPLIGVFPELLAGTDFIHMRIVAEAGAANTSNVHVYGDEFDE